MRELAYGYRAVDDNGSRRIEIDPGAAAVVRRVFHHYAAGTSPIRIASALTEEGDTKLSGPKVRSC